MVSLCFHFRLRKLRAINFFVFSVAVAVQQLQPDILVDCFAPSPKVNFPQSLSREYGRINPFLWNGSTDYLKLITVIESSYQQHDEYKGDDLRLMPVDASSFSLPTLSIGSLASVALLVLITTIPLPAIAEVTGTFSSSTAIPSAIAAYTHYLFLLIFFGLLVYERLTIQACMSPETEKSLGVADALYGISGLIIVASGYFRAVEYGKGWDFYSHEFLFWFKMSAIALLGGLSLFPTITFVKRTVAIVREETIEPMSEKLAKRLRQIINAEISAILSIPLFASLMARGVSYNKDFSWEVGAAFVAVILLGSGFVYAKQALTWQEEDNLSN